MEITKGKGFAPWRGVGGGGGGEDFEGGGGDEEAWIG